MGGASRISIAVTTGATGGGTTSHSYPVNGHVAEVRYGGSVFAGTATYTLTRVEDGGTVLAYTATVNPWQRAPRQQVSTQSGGTVAASIGGSALVDYIPVDGYLRLVVANAGSVVTDSVHVYIG